jgi:hypothetical protein
MQNVKSMLSYERCDPKGDADVIARLFPKLKNPDAGPADLGSGMAGFFETADGRRKAGRGIVHEINYHAFRAADVQVRHHMEHVQSCWLPGLRH